MGCADPLIQKIFIGLVPLRGLGCDVICLGTRSQRGRFFLASVVQSGSGHSS
jgi:hypothetical protein